MFDQLALEGEFFEMLRVVDEQIVAKAAELRCPHCGGPLHRSDYDRKPRGGSIGVAGETFSRRFSLCCGREGCRRRATPLSVRFLGRRVYLGAVVVVASAIAVVVTVASALRRATGVSPRTTRRWLQWWRGPFTKTGVYVELMGKLQTPVSRMALPHALLERLGDHDQERVAKLLGWLAPLTTTTSHLEPSFVGAVM